MKTQRNLAIAVAAAIGLAVTSSVFAHGWGPGYGAHHGYRTNTNFPHWGGRAMVEHHRYVHGGAPVNLQDATWYGPRTGLTQGAFRNGTGPRTQIGDCPFVEQQTAEQSN